MHHDGLQPRAIGTPRACSIGDRATCAQNVGRDRAIEESAEAVATGVVIRQMLIWAVRWSYYRLLFPPGHKFLTQTKVFPSIGRLGLGLGG